MKVVADKRIVLRSPETESKSRTRMKEEPESRSPEYVTLVPV
jgi:hypothetical protein